MSESHKTVCKTALCHREIGENFPERIPRVVAEHRTPSAIEFFECRELANLSFLSIRGRIKVARTLEDNYRVRLHTGVRINICTKKRTNNSTMLQTRWKRVTLRSFSVRAKLSGMYGTWVFNTITR